MNTDERVEISHEEFEQLESRMKELKLIYNGIQSTYWVRTGRELDFDDALTMSLIKLLGKQE